MEKSIRDSEEKFRGLFNNHSATKIIVDPQSGKIVDANKSAEEFYGWSIDELKSMTIYELNTLPPIEVDKHMAMALEQSSNHFVFKHRRADGIILHVDVYSSRVSIGDKTYLYSIVHDVSQKEEFENALRQSEQRLKLILDTTAEGIYVVDTQGICTTINRAALELLGYQSEGELLGKKIHGITHHSYPDGSPYPEEECRVHKSFVGNTPNYSDKEVFWRKGGESFQVEYWSYPILQDDIAVGSVVSFLNIDERLKAEEENKMLSHTIKSINDCVSVTDLNNNLLFVNDAFLKTYGYTRPELIGKHISMVNSGRNNRINYDSITQQTINGGWQGELWNTRSDGSEFQVFLSTSVIRDNYGNTVALVGVANDITERKMTLEYIAKKLETEKILSRVSSLAIENIPYHTFLESCMSDVGSSLKISRIYMFEHNTSSSSISNTFEWCAQGINPDFAEQKDFPLSVGVWWMEELLKDQHIMFNRVEEIPNQATMEYLQSRGVLSIFIVPLFVNAEYFGFIGYEECVCIREWQVEDKNFLFSISNIISGMLERNHSIESLRVSEEKYRRITDNISDVVWTVDLNFKTTYISPSVERMLGESAEEHINKTMEQKFTPSSLQLIHSVFEEEMEREKDKSVNKSRTRQVEVEQYTKAGTTIWVGMNISFLRDEAGKVIGFQGVTRDIAERKRAELGLIKLNDELEGRVKEKTQELNDRIAELEQFYNATIDRELRMKELREELKRLKEGNSNDDSMK